MLHAFSGTELSIFNGGAIRIDDVLPPGDVTEYDVMRILPYGGKAVSVKIKGRMLQRVLAQGRANRGSGGYLHTANVCGIDPGTWLINDKLLNRHRFYQVAINDFLLSGNEEGLGFLNRQSKEIIMPQAPEQADMRRLLIEQLRRAKKSTPSRWKTPYRGSAKSWKSPLSASQTQSWVKRSKPPLS
jgi:5'-nucleotidase